MNEYYKHLRLQAIAAHVLAAEAAGILEGWRDYLANEMKTAGLTNEEVAAEIKRQRSLTLPVSGGRSE